MLRFSRRLIALAAMGLAPLFTSGCQFVPASKLAAAQSQNRTLSEQSRAQLAEIQNLKVHSRKVEDQLMEAEAQLAQLDKQLGAGTRQLANFQEQRAKLQQQFEGLARAGGAGIPVGLNNRLAELSQKYPSLHYDPQTGAARFDGAVLFDSADAKLKPEAEQMLGEFARIFQSQDARDLKIMVVGHTDELKIARKEDRQRHPDNWHLSTERALAVVDHLRRAGLPEDRMGVSGFGGTQPIASNDSALDRRRNRRVEIFVLAPDVPVVGWTESSPSLYR